jgi:type VI secretion system secreted protein VgrG
MVGKAVSVCLSVHNDYDSGPKRYFHGVVKRFSEIESDENFFYYRAQIIPWLGLLAMDSSCRIFQEKTVPEIVKAVFDEYKQKFPGLVSYREDLNRSYTKVDYCVQYRESSFQFVSRLLEEEGIFYFFEHSSDKHTLVMADYGGAHKDCPDQPTGRLVKHEGWADSQNPIFSWQIQQELRPGVYTLRDFHFQMPSKNLQASESTVLPVDAAKPLEVYDYPGEYASRFNQKGRHGEVEPEAEKQAKLRMEEHEAGFQEIAAESLCRGFLPGYKFELVRNVGAGKKYILTAVEHRAVQTPWYRSDLEAPTADEPYRNQFTCIPEDVPYRPRRVTPKPIVNGPQTAVVVGKSGEEIWTDEFGRVKVQFPWDREGKFDERSSCWVRVSHPWAGKNWGSVSIPRIGQEVIVDFLEGDPDQPIITGRVYNADVMPPYKLPGGGVVSGLKTNSTKGGGGYNEMSMDDTKGTTVEHDDTQTVHNNRSITVDGTHTEKIDKDTSITVISGKSLFDVQTGTHTHHVKGEVTENYDATQQTTVKDDITIKSTTAKITVDASTEIFLHCGESTLSMKQDGTIKISGNDIEIAGKVTAKVGVGSQNTVYDTQKVGTSGAAINSSATGMHEITGALVKIN